MFSFGTLCWWGWSLAQKWDSTSVPTLEMIPPRARVVLTSLDGAPTVFRRAKRFALELYSKQGLRVMFAVTEMEAESVEALEFWLVLLLVEVSDEVLDLWLASV